MKNPELVVESTLDDSFISITLFICANFKVRIEGNTLKNKALMWGMSTCIFGKSTCVRKPAKRCPDRERSH
jgi:hypothetical protein